MATRANILDIKNRKLFLDIKNRKLLAFMKLQVAPMTPTEFRLNRTYHLGEDVV